MQGFLGMLAHRIEAMAVVIDLVRARVQLEKAPREFCSVHCGVLMMRLIDRRPSAGCVSGKKRGQFVSTD